MSVAFALGVVMLSSTAAVGAGHYVGSAACARCHADISRSYGTTAMANASGKVEPGALLQPKLGSFVHVLSGTEYRLEADAAGLDLRFSKTSSANQKAVAGNRRLEYFIGSGRHARGYLYRADGGLFQAPVAFYRDKNAWDMAPGFETLPYISLGRKIEQPCLDCHSSGSSEREPIHEGAVGCERCHGPGSEHVDPGRPGAVLAILNPPRLNAAERDSVCAQCHLTGEVRVQKAGASVFRPGARLTDHVVPYIWSTAGSENPKVIGHFEGLWLSQCKRASGDRLWCGTCHDPHQEPAPAEKAAYFRSKCLTCHGESSCLAKASARAQKGDDCAACHMPKRQAVDGLHAAFTDHDIRRPGERKKEKTDGERELVPFWPGTGSDRDLGLAYADVAWRSRKKADFLRAFDVLKRALASAEEDSEVLSNLGYLYDLGGDEAQATALYRRALKVNPDSIVALTNLGQHMAVSDKPGEATQLWERAIREDPGLVTPALNLARALLETGDAGGAEKAVEQVLQFTPDSARALELKELIEGSRK